jgi:hypothetical protein
MSWKGDLVHAGIETDGKNVEIHEGQFLVNGETFRKTSPATITTADNVTYTAAQLIGGLVLRDPNGGARSDVSPTAALIVAAVKNAEVGSSFDFTIRNDADAAETITLTAGTGVTLNGTMTVAQNEIKRFLVRITAVASPAVTIYASA